MKKLITVLFLFTSINAFAEIPYADDSDLGGPAIKAKGSVHFELMADDMKLSKGDDIKVVLETKRGTFEIQGLEFKKTEKNGICTGVAELKDKYFDVTDGKYTYQVKFEAECAKSVLLTFAEESDGGQALGIYRISHLAEQKLAASVGLDFWKNQISLEWPASGDYYSWNTVHLTKGYQWDVVGHELGHAIYDQARLGQFGGGQHYIDRCYSDALALSEGWASYFSSWISLELNDTDAKFEYMVPRRAPIRFETIPGDVCAGPTSEWRVIGFFWDFIDLNQDGETANEVFARLWNALKGSKAGGVREAAQLLEKAGFDSATVDLIWFLNFTTKRQ